MADTAKTPEINPRPRIDRIRRGAVIVGIFIGLGAVILVSLRATAPPPRAPQEPAPVRLADPAMTPEQLERLRPPEPLTDLRAATLRPAPRSAPPPAPHPAAAALSRRARRPAPPRVAPLAVRLDAPRSRTTVPGASPTPPRGRPGALGAWGGLDGLAATLGAAGQPAEAAPEPADPRQLAWPGDPVLEVRLSPPPTPWVVRQGTLVPAVLTHAVSSAVGGMLRAQVTRDVYDAATLSQVLIPRGTVALAEQSRQPLLGEKRLLVVWRRLVFPDGRSFELTAPAAAPDGALGLPGRVRHHWGQRFGAAALLSVVGAGFQLSQPQRSGRDGAAPSSGEVAAGAAGLELGRLAQEILSEHTRIPPTVTLEPGSPVALLAVQDLAFPEPYTPNH